MYYHIKVLPWLCLKPLDEIVFITENFKMYIIKLQIGVQIIYGKLQYNKTDSVDVEVRSKELLSL